MAKTRSDIEALISKLKSLKTENMYLDDFFHTWKKSDDEIDAVFTVAEILRGMREQYLFKGLRFRAWNQHLPR